MGLVRTGVSIVRDEGFVSLWNGLPPALARGFLYGGMRLGLYGPCRDSLAALAAAASSSPAAASAPSSAPGRQHQACGTGAGAAAAGVGVKVAAGTFSGALAAGLTSPTELVKTRLQARDNVARGTLEVVQHVVRQDGVLGLWRGAVPSMARAGLLTASQVATYDTIKHDIMKYGGWGDNTATHVAASSITGLVTTTVTNPADVIKTNMFVSGGASKGNITHTALDILRRDGLAGFMKGWSANYARLGPQTMITFLISEALRRELGLQGL
ncbi:hypothetical protein GPECTOR_19g379 [Gonium pectorale]|uniref:Uncharacterized protein n=1 Tax=Gonium pectorale TaxID=33097 RepID=A0A150GJD8_GONPE|nr:hypothetical protein GPECTOR_19g379 [Gonium pectorale]|eukprot:KXZ49928.1 hypothetical protein GPECTOR_19g379 [Gonium pectorale]